METLLVAKYTYPKDFDQAERDLRLFQVYRTRLGPVTLIVQSPDRSAHVWREDDIEVHYIPRDYGFIGLVTFWLRALRRAREVLKRKDIAILEASDLAGAFVLIPIRRWARLPLLLHLQFQFFGMSSRAASWWKRRALWAGARVACHFADSIRCVSWDIHEQAIRAGVDSSKLHVIHTRCDPDLFNPVRVVARSPGTGRVLMYAGSLTRLKGLDVLLDAMPMIVRRFPDVRLRLVGDGPDRVKLMRRAKETESVLRVEFIGSVPYSQLPLLLRECDLLVHPALTEGMPRAILEAMAMARPVVATRVGGIPEAVRDGVDGLLVPPGDASALGEAVCRLLDSPDLARSMGEAGRLRILDHFSFQQNVAALVQWHEKSAALTRVVRNGEGSRWV